MHSALACLLMFATGVLPTLGTPHMHSEEMEHAPTDSVAAVQHTHGIGLDHHHDVPDARHDDAEAPCGTQNLDGDRLVMFARSGASTKTPLRAAVGCQCWLGADELCRDQPSAWADHLSVTGPPRSIRDQLEVHVTAPRRGPPLPSV